MHKIYSLMFAGVGGQGSLLVADITSLAAVQAGYDVKQTEVHGVSQRGGSVETHVRFGEKVHSPLVTPGQADVVLGLEKLEALRFAHFANLESGYILVNDYEIIPASVPGAENLYPHEVVDYLRDKGYKVITLPASEIARDLGDGRMANVVMLGAMSNILPIPHEIWDKTLRMRIPTRYLNPNLQAFAKGRNLLAVQQPVL
ncbi:MAG: indolepyruvate oxidoreductase subunit beta [Anaerolineales bacterium]|nr:MAG: indolepyruvate oxidoreductase subunit beta [Anaerolineales bacterium]